MCDVCVLLVFAYHTSIVFTLICGLRRRYTIYYTTTTVNCKGLLWLQKPFCSDSYWLEKTSELTVSGGGGVAVETRNGFCERLREYNITYNIVKHYYTFIRYCIFV